MKIYLDVRSVLGISSIKLVVYVLLLNIRTSSPEEAHSRQKRILWVTSDGRLALPPGTTLIISPSLSLPFVRYPPDGFFSNLTISLPFTIDFDKLGLSDNENPYGVLPPLLARSMGRAAGNFLGSYIERRLFHHRTKRSKSESLPELPAQQEHAFHGGERALLYVVVEEFLENFGMDGRACLLRAICEVHAHPLDSYGFVGELIKLFLSASKSPYADMLKEYVEAENAGKGKPGTPGECWPYLKDCPKSLFKAKHNHYNPSPEEHKNIEEEITNEINEISGANKDASKVTYKSTMANM